MGDDMFIIAYEQAVIMHDQRHIHVIMNIIVNPTSHQPLPKNGSYNLKPFGSSANEETTLLFLLNKTNNFAGTI